MVLFGFCENSSKLLQSLRCLCATYKRIVFRTTKTEYESPAEFRYVLCRFMSFSEHAPKEMGITP